MAWNSSLIPSTPSEMPARPISRAKPLRDGRLCPSTTTILRIPEAISIGPALQQLLKDIDAGRIDVIVVYKIDRLTRSLADFAKLVEAFDAKSISFVAVTQQFNTTTSMGRLTLNVLLSFAQFERELSSERVRDKGRGVQAERKMDRRHRAARLRRPGEEAGHQQGGGRDRPLHLQTVSGVAEFREAGRRSRS